MEKNQTEKIYPSEDQVILQLKTNEHPEEKEPLSNVALQPESKIESSEKGKPVLVREIEFKKGSHEDKEAAGPTIVVNSEEKIVPENPSKDDEKNNLKNEPDLCSVIILYSTYPTSSFFVTLILDLVVGAVLTGFGLGLLFALLAIMLFGLCYCCCCGVKSGGSQNVVVNKVQIVQNNNIDNRNIQIIGDGNKVEIGGNNNNNNNNLNQQTNTVVNETTRESDLEKLMRFCASCGLKGLAILICAIGDAIYSVLKNCELIRKGVINSKNSVGDNMSLFWKNNCYMIRKYLN